MAYERELETAQTAAREAAAILREHYARETKSWEKSEDNPVTAADLASDQAIARRLREYADTAVDAETGTPDLMGEKRTPESTRRGLAEASRRRRGEAPPEPQPELLPPGPVQPKPKKPAPQEKPPAEDEGGLFSDELDDELEAEVNGDFDASEAIWDFFKAAAGR